MFNCNIFSLLVFFKMGCRVKLYKDFSFPQFILSQISNIMEFTCKIVTDLQKKAPNFLTLAPCSFVTTFMHYVTMSCASTSNNNNNDFTILRTNTFYHLKN